MIKKLFDLVFTSIRGRLVLVEVTLYAILMGFVVFYMLSKQQDFMKNQLSSEAKSIALALSVNAPSWLLSYDVAGLGELVNSLKSVEHLSIAMIIDENQKVVASTDLAIVNVMLDDVYSNNLIHTANTSSSSQIWHDGMCDSVKSIVSNGVVIGYSRVILDTRVLNDKINDIRIQGIIYVLIAMLIGGMAIWFSVYSMTKQLKLLSDATDEVANGNLKIIIADHKSKDEIGKLTDNFNGMVQKLQKAVIQSRLALMGELLSMIAHQWRQPLAAISATSSAIGLKAKLGVLDDDTAAQMGDQITSYVQHLSETIDDFRNFYRTTKEKKQTTYEEIIDSVLAIIHTSIESKKIDLITDFQCNKSIYSYPNEIKQVVLNLIKNSEDILVEKNIENPYIKIETRITDDFYILAVSDNGGGIPANIIDHIFEAYYSTKTHKDGTGLGLYMSKTMIEEHCGGVLYVQNTKDGALFEIRLPNE